ncbi:MAG: hypothetical protein Q4D34_01190 [Eggerthellaceae bacterium]|nr:hypothetical protein [Eggerthellaceae bacterium]
MELFLAILSAVFVIFVAFMVERQRKQYGKRTYEQRRDAMHDNYVERMETFRQTEMGKKDFPKELASGEEITPEE